MALVDRVHVESDPIQPYIIFDIDGTISNLKHRLFRIKEKNPDWEAFNREMIHDALHHHIAAIYYAMCKRGMNSHPSIFVTGRPENYRYPTTEWLKKHDIHPNYLFMRPYKDYRSDVEIKREIHDKYIKGAPVMMVFDDRDRVVEMWRELGYKCLQTQKGDY